MTKSALIAVLLMAFVVAADAGAEALESGGLTDQKKALIGELLTLTGANDFSTTMMNFYVGQMASVLKKVNPEIDQQAFVIIEEEVRAVMREALAGDALNEQITYPIYHRHLSAADIQALVDFYKTPAGRRVLAALPVITEEGRRAGQAWGAELVPKMQARVLERLKDAELVD